MRILHFADLHIGVETHGRPDPATGLSTRLFDFLAVFDELVEAALAEQVDLVLFAGDAYKSRDPSQTHQREFALRVRRLVDAGIPVYLLVGNHDLPNLRAKANALDIFRTLGVERVYVGDQLGTQIVETASGPVQIVGVPWPSVSQMLGREAARGMTIQEIDRALEATVAAGIAREAAALDPAIPALLTAHIAIADSIVKTASEKLITTGRFPQLRVAQLSPDHFDYVALGHHHPYQVLREHPPVIYAGSLQRVDFGEEADPKGFVILDLDPALPQGERVPFRAVHFREVQARRFVSFDCRLRSDDPTAELLAAFARVDVEDAFVRVRVVLSPEQSARLDERAARAALRAGEVVAFSREIARGTRRRLVTDAPAETLTPLESLGVYLDALETPEARKVVLLEHARGLVDELGMHA